MIAHFHLLYLLLPIAAPAQTAAPYSRSNSVSGVQLVWRPPHWCTKRPRITGNGLATPRRRLHLARPPAASFILPTPVKYELPMGVSTPGSHPQDRDRAFAELDWGYRWLRFYQ